MTASWPCLSTCVSIAPYCMECNVSHSCKTLIEYLCIASEVSELAYCVHFNTLHFSGVHSPLLMSCVLHIEYQVLRMMMRWLASPSFTWKHQRCCLTTGAAACPLTYRLNLSAIVQQLPMHPARITMSMPGKQVPGRWTFITSQQWTEEGNVCCADCH